MVSQSRLTLLCWNLFQEERKIKSINVETSVSDGCTLSIQILNADRKLETITKSCSYPSVVCNLNKTPAEKLDAFIDGYSYLHWPATPKLILLAVLWIGFSVGSLNELSLRNPLLSSLHTAAMVVLRTPTVAWYCLVGMFVIHVLEALYVMVLLRGIVTAPRALLSWFVMTVVLGFPSTQQAMVLSKIDKKTS